MLVPEYAPDTTSLRTVSLWDEWKRSVIVTGFKIEQTFPRPDILRHNVRRYHGHPLVTEGGLYVGLLQMA